ncbi:hypothetical protein SpCBS45565_g06123 [Spizellomyces sp. 'palustris']|nr:hypothetical protein SpCBS45565_g06123 [Spizellomyces sp. 'palustris']
MNRLPAELIVEIIHTIEHQPTLAGAAQVCKLWNSLATPLLYRIPKFGSSLSFQSFLRTVSENSTLGDIVREVDLLSSPWPRWLVVDSQTITTLGKGCPQLTYLDLEGCTALRDKGIVSLAENCPGLQYLSLSECDKVSDEGMLAIATHCIQLRILELKAMPMVSDLSVEELALNCTFLESVALAGTRVTDRSVTELIERAQRLAYLDLSLCYNVVDLDKIMEEKPEHLEIVIDTMPTGSADWEETDWEGDDWDGEWDGEWDEDEDGMDFENDEGWPNVHFSVDLDI